jgi:uncharacterized metal-binding protein
MDIPTDITIVAGLAIVAGLVIVAGMIIVAQMVIVDHGVDPGAGDDLKDSEATSSILNLKPFFMHISSNNR